MSSAAEFPSSVPPNTKGGASQASVLSYETQKRQIMAMRRAEMLKRRQWLFSAFVIGASIILSSTIIAGAIGGAQSAIPFCPNKTAASDPGALNDTAAEDSPDGKRVADMPMPVETTTDAIRYGCIMEGYVYDLNYHPLNNAEVKMPDGLSSVVTDSNGFYSYDQCFTNPIIGLTVTKSGYITQTFYGASDGFVIRMRPEQ